MDDDELTEAQRLAFDWLNQHIKRNPTVLRKHCKLDFGRHQLSPQVSLGNLEKLPLELRCLIFEVVDVKSLLVFRRVCQKAMADVDAIPAFKKVMTHASDAVRLAIDIDTAHTFTIKQICAKLCQQLCDSSCGKAAPYLDMFRLTRQCYRAGGECDLYEGVISTDALAESCWNRSLSNTGNGLVNTEISFIVFEQRISALVKSSQLPCYSIHSAGKLRTFYDNHDASQLLASKGYSMDPNRRFAIELLLAYIRSQRTARISTAVLAPWAESKGHGFVNGVFCEKCVESASRKSPPSRNLQDLFAGERLGMLILAKLAFGDSNMLAKHLEEDHSNDAASNSL